MPSFFNEFRNFRLPRNVVEIERKTRGACANDDDLPNPRKTSIELIFFNFLLFPEPRLLSWPVIRLSSRGTHTQK